METRANYVLIGAVTLLGVIAAFAFFLWYARIAIDRQYDYYAIRFDQVSGLSRAGDVRFNGILVGQVISIDLSRTGTQVRVDIQVQDGTPIDSGTVATLRSQGVTGVSYVSLASGPVDAPPLEIDPAIGMRVIKSEPSVIDSLIEGAPALLREATDLLRQLSGFVGPENQQRVTEILDNVETASGGLEKALTDFSAISSTVREGVDQISAFTGRLDSIASQAESTLKTADATLTSATGAFDIAKGTLQSATGALDAAQTTFKNADALVTGRGPALVDSYEGVARSLTTTVDDLGTRSAALIGRLDGATDLAAARLREAEAPIAAVAPALTAVEGAAGGVERLLSGDGAALVAGGAHGARDLEPAARDRRADHPRGRAHRRGHGQPGRRGGRRGRQRLLRPARRAERGGRDRARGRLRDLPQRHRDAAVDPARGRLRGARAGVGGFGLRRGGPGDERRRRADRRGPAGRDLAVQRRDRPGLG